MDEQYKPLFEEATPTAPPRKQRGKLGVLLVQSICCAVLLLLFWLFKVLGGDSYTALKTALYNALENNVLMETVSDMLTETPPTTTGTTAVGTSTTTVPPTTAPTTAATVPSNG